MTNTYDMLLNPPPRKPTAEQPPTPVEKPVQAKPVKPHAVLKSSHSSPPPVTKLDQPKPPENEERNKDVGTDVMIDVMTSQSQDVNLKEWQEIIEDTETQNSALRLTSEERYAIEDVVNELRRKYGIKTSMNEIARLGLLLLIQDFKQRKKESIIHKVKKA
jgi:hypothetical protein